MISVLGFIVVLIWLRRLSARFASVGPGFGRVSAAGSGLGWAGCFAAEASERDGGRVFGLAHVISLNGGSVAGIS